MTVGPGPTRIGNIENYLENQDYNDLPILYNIALDIMKFSKPRSDSWLQGVRYCF